MSSNFHVAIIGGGLGGLCLAQGLRKAGIAFDVYEKDPAPDSRTQGYRIRIDDGGQRALAVNLTDDLYSLFRDTCALSGTGGRFLDTALKPATGRPIESWRPSAIGDAVTDASGLLGDLSVHRLTLRQILLGGLEPRMHFGKSFRRADRCGDGRIEIAFDDGSSVRSDIVVGADGINSPVRAQRWPHAAPVDTGSVCIYGKTVLTPEVQGRVARVLQSGTSVVFATGFAVIIDAMRFRPSPSCLTQHPLPCRLSPVDDYLYWAFIGPRDCFGFDEVADLPPGGASIGSIVACRTYDWHPGLKALFECGDRTALAVVPVRCAAPQKPWIPTPVTILGDAAHAMSPAGGLGANTALADAAKLTARLVDAAAGRLSPLAAIAAYEQDMRQRAAIAIDLSQQAATRLFSR